MCSRATAFTRPSLRKSSTTTFLPEASTCPDSDSAAGSTSPSTSSAAFPAAWVYTSCVSPAGTASAARSAPDSVSASRVTRFSTCVDWVPDSSSRVISVVARSQRSCRRASSYRRALSIATPAAAASATTSVSSSSSNCPPPSFSVR